MPAINARNPSRGVRMREVLRVLEISMISLIRLILGGAAMLAADIMNQSIVMAGNRLISPLVRSRLRVWVVSYVMLARENIAEEHRPWAIIIVKAEDQPQVELDMVPAIKSPICPTEE